MEQTAVPPIRPSFIAEIQDIRDIKEPVGPFPNYFPMIIPLISALLVAFLIYKVKRGRTKALPVRSSYEIACDALAALKEKNLIENGKMMDYYVELSNIIRHYLGIRLNYRMMSGMTTEEFLWSVKEGEEVSQEKKELVRDFLFHCDSVKFAGYRSSGKEAEIAFEMGMNILK